jgi:hypothetical protein
MINAGLAIMPRASIAKPRDKVSGALVALGNSIVGCSTESPGSGITGGSLTIATNAP